MESIELPRLAGSREAADELVSGVRQGSDAVLIDASGLVSGSPSFANQLVVRLLQDKEAGRIDVVAPPGDFLAYLQDAAAALGRGDSLREVARGALLRASHAQDR